MSIGDRLQLALHRREMSVRKFQKVISGTEEKGTSYPQIHRYLKGESEPSLSFLRGASSVLGVREAWLAFGQGQMTEEEEQADAIWNESRRGGGDLTERIKEAVPWLAHGPSPAGDSFWQILRQVLRHRMVHFPRDDPGFTEHMLEVARELDSFLRQGTNIVLQATVDPQGISAMESERLRLGLLNALVVGMTDWIVSAPT